MHRIHVSVGRAVVWVWLLGSAGVVACGCVRNVLRSTAVTQLAQ